ncbi:hypothetical protein [Demequina aurantiaca]|uniref:hypothetical protein n=1 Tax=Demequina aurantiaca TaxID=676200 RepID=UPI000782DA15|nr:hypothetical protein [Demequina aurantiaca]
MTRKYLLICSGAVLAAAGLYLFARFWNLSGAETPPNGSGMLSSMDWGTFFISPVLFLGGVAIVFVGALSGRHRHHRSPTPADTNAQMRILESTH